MKPSALNRKPDRSERLVQYCKRFSNVRLMVVGDVMLDHYIWGGVERISPEAPVPVVAVSNESIHLGGAANVAHNVVSLGGKVDLCGVIGKDDFGGRILRELKRLRIGTEGLLVDPDRPTTKKTRVIAHNQQVVRFDHELRQAVSERTRRSLLEFIGRRIPRVNGLVVSDYSKGVITGELMKDLIGLAHHHNVPIIVDPKVGHISFYKGVQVITPNTAEAFGAAGLENRSEDDLLRAGQILLERLGCRAVLVTRGEHGMSLFGTGRRPLHIPTTAREVFDVTGAGDTVVAVCALALAGGANYDEAAVLANIAAGFVGDEVGTVAVPAAKIKDMIKDKKL